MTSTLPLIHRFQPQVENLRKHFAESGTPLTHAEALKAVAQQEGAHSWDELTQEPKRHWITKMLGWGSTWKRRNVGYLDELMFDVNMNRIHLGTAENFKKPNASQENIELYLDWAKRHILLVGPHGKGATTAPSHYAAQYIATGGGCLILDRALSDGNANILEQVAQACGRADFKRYRYDLPESERADDAKTVDLREAVTQAKVAYVNLPSNSESEENKLTIDLIQQLEQVGREQYPNTVVSRPRPFLVMFLEEPSGISKQWKSFLEHARGYNMIVYLRLFSLTNLDNVPTDVSQVIQSFATQLYLEPDSPSSLEAAAKMLVLSDEPEKLAQAKKALANLGLGEALMSRPVWNRDYVHPVNRASEELVAVRLCMLAPETRQDWEDRKTAFLNKRG